MESEAIDWEQELPLDADEAYQSLVRSLRRTNGFALLFVRCSPVQGDLIITDVRADLPSKTIEVLELKESIDNLYDHVAALPNHDQINVLFIKGIEYSIFAYEDREMNDINLRSQSSVYGGTWQGIPRILGHLNLSRERFRDKFKFCFVFLLPEFAIRYFIRRAPDFFDWRSNVYDFPSDRELVEKESFQIIQESYSQGYQLNLLNLRDIFRDFVKNNKEINLFQRHILQRFISPLLFDIEYNYSSAWNLFSDFFGISKNKEIGTIELLYTVVPELKYTKLSRLEHIKRILHIKAWLSEDNQPSENKVKLLYEKGLLFHSSGDYEEAITSYDDVLQLQDDYLKAWISRAMALYALGRDEEVSTSYERAVKCNPKNSLLLLLQADSLWESGKYIRAFRTSCKFYGQFVSIFQSSILILFAYILFYLHRYNIALLLLEKSLELKPDVFDLESFAIRYFKGNEKALMMILGKALKNKSSNLDIWNDGGFALFNFGKYEEALSVYERALQINPESYEVWDKRGSMLAALNRNEEALQAYDKALQIKPDLYATWNNRGCALAALGRTEEAIAAYHKALQIKSEFYEPWYNLGGQLLDLGRYEESIKAYDKAIQLKLDDHVLWYAKDIRHIPIKPNKYLALIGQGNALQNLGRYEEAIASYDKAIEIKPDYYEAWYNRGNALGNLGRYDEAIASYDKALEFNPKYHKAWNTRGNTLFDLGKNEMAIASYDKALEFNPNLHDAYNKKGIALSNLGRCEEAILSYNKLLKLIPEHHLAWYNKACAYSLQNQIELALESLQKAIQLNPEENRKIAKTDSDFDNIRHDRRFQALIQ